MKKLIALILCLVIVLSLAACGAKEEAPVDTPAETYNLKIGTTLAQNDPIAVGLFNFETAVEEATNGGIDVEIYVASALGADEDLIEQATMGAGIGMITDSGRLGTYVTGYGIIGAPYLMNDYDEALKILDTEAYARLCEELTNVGLRVLSGNWFAGPRHLFTKEPVTTPDDLKGMRMRSSGSAVVNGTLSAMGGDPVVLPWAETYSALQSKTADGCEVNNGAAVDSSIYEVTSYLIKTGHFQHMLSLVVSDSWFKDLPTEYQEALVTAAYDSGLIASKGSVDNDAAYEQTLVDKGMTIVEVDKEAFIAATESVYDELGLADLRAEIYAEIGK